MTGYHAHRRAGWLAAALVLAVAACSRTEQGGQSTNASGDAAFERLAGTVLQDYYRRHPTQATDLGIHDFDEELEDYSRESIAAQVSRLRSYRLDLAAIDPSTLSLDKQLDRSQVLSAIDSE